MAALVSTASVSAALVSAALVSAALSASVEFAVVPAVGCWWMFSASAVEVVSAVTATDVVAVGASWTEGRVVSPTLSLCPLKVQSHQILRAILLFIKLNQYFLYDRLWFLHFLSL
jgi:hypothetical protein